MAVEARHLSLFSPQLLGNRELVNAAAAVEGNATLYGNSLGYNNGLMAPLSGTTTVETMLPMYGGSAITDSVAAAKVAAIRADSGLTRAFPVSRKRSRDAISPLLSFPIDQIQINQSNRCGSFTFLGEDISLQIQQQQLEIDRFIAQHMEKVRIEIEESRKRFSRRIMTAVDEGIVKKLKAKEAEIEKIGKLNWALEEKVKSLCIENQIWRDLAHTNEATANTLRTNLEQVLAQVKVEQCHNSDRIYETAALMDDAESCCGSNYVEGGYGEDDTRTMAEVDRNVLIDRVNSADGAGPTNSSTSNRWCRNCGKNESCVLLLPCRHLCLCTVCGSSLHICPVCKSTKNASVHVNMSF